MPQMSPMDWFMLFFYFILIYFMILLMIYFIFLIKINKNNNLQFYILKYKFDW